MDEWERTPRVLLVDEPGTDGAQLDVDNSSTGEDSDSRPADRSSAAA